MKEFTEKLISRLEEESCDMEICEEQFDMNRPYFKDVPYKMLKLEDVKTIISQFAEEYLPDTNVGNKDGKTLAEQECFDEEGEEMLLIEDVLDTLIEVGNGVTDEALHESADKLFRVRDILNSKANDDGWIPVEERLPDNNEPVLCWVKSTTIASGETYIIGSCSNKCWFLQTYEIGHHYFPVKDYEVAAWMPLPEPYKQEGE